MVEWWSNNKIDILAGIFPFRSVAYLNLFFFSIRGMVSNLVGGLLVILLIVGSEIEEAVDAIGVS